MTPAAEMPQPQQSVWQTPQTFELSMSHRTCPLNCHSQKRQGPSSQLPAGANRQVQVRVLPSPGGSEASQSLFRVRVGVAHRFLQMPQQQSRPTWPPACSRAHHPRVPLTP